MRRQDPDRKHRRLTGALIVVLLLACCALWWTSEEEEATPPAPDLSGPGAPQANPPRKDGAFPLAGSDRLSALLDRVAGNLRDGHSPGGPHQQLAELRQALSTAERREALAAIRRFLDSGGDAPGDGEFQVGAGGSLVRVPSLRVFLLDLLSELDPKAAVVCSKAILASPRSPDEWAIALRNVARFDSAPDSREFLEQRISEMLRNELWVNDPSAGFLEAFDVSVHVGGTNLLPPLAGLLTRKDNQAVAHAAFLALDRMVIREPVEVLRYFEDHPDLMQGREQARADYFARADVRDPQQRQVLESYLLDPECSAAELAQFAGVFPNANYMISHNLVTSDVTLNSATRRQRDREALRAVEEWGVDPRFNSIQPQLEKMHRRLAEFVRQVGASP